MPGPKGAIRVALSASISGLDPHEDIGGPELQILVNLYEGLVGLDPEMRVEPRLARSWESIDDRTWIMRLRDGVVFHDGSRFDADDVLFSFARTKTESVAALPSVRVIDSMTVELTLERPDPLFLAKIAEIFIVPDGVEGEGAPGTGPYRFLEQEDNYFKLQAFPNHWRGSPPIETVYLLATPEDVERVEGLLDGLFDFVPRFPMQLSHRIEAREEYEVRSIRSLRLDYVGLRVDRPPFDDRRVRQAMSLAIDRQVLVDEIHSGFAVPLNQFADSNVRGHVPDRSNLTPDLERARELLAEAGYPDGLSITLEGTGVKKLDALSRQLEPAGFSVTQEAWAWSEFYPRVKKGEVDAWMMAWLYFSPDLSELLEQLLHSTSAGLGVYNHQGYSNPDLDAVIEELTRTSDTEDRQELMALATEILLEDLPIIPLKAPLLSYAYHHALNWDVRHDGVMELFRFSWEQSKS